MLLDNGRMASASVDASAFHRSSVHILLSDKDSKSRQDVLELLRRCSYQVTPVENARQALEVLRSGGPAVDLILAEVELPNGKGFKMLKYIMKEERLKQIPVVMMSTRDEMAVVVKSLRLGAADYLVKPLRTNELLNLWTHMWRRRRGMGLLDRPRVNGLNINDPPLDLMLQDPSESNTNSTDLFSDDTDEKKTAGPASSVLEVASGDDYKEDRPRSPVLELSLKLSADASHLRASFDVERKSREIVPEKLPAKPSPPQKTGELRIGQSSAFVNFGNANSKERTNSPAGAKRADKELGGPVAMQVAAFSNSPPRRLNEANSPMLPLPGEVGRTNRLECSPPGNSQTSRSDLPPDRLTLSMPPSEEHLSLSTTATEYRPRRWGEVQPSLASSRALPLSSGLSTAVCMDGHDRFGREGAREGPLQDGYMRDIYLQDVNSRDSFSVDMYARENGKAALLREAYIRDSLLREGKLDAFSRGGVGHDSPYGREGVHEAFVRDGFSKEVYGGETPSWSRRDLPVEPVRSSFPPNNPFSLMKLRIPPDAHPEMGPMLPPSIPSHIPLPHSVPHHLPHGLASMQGLPPHLHPGALVQQSIPTMYGGPVMPPDPSGLSIPSPGIAAPHPLGGPGLPGPHYPFFRPVGLGPGPSMISPAQLLGPPSAPWPSMQVSVSERKLELAERREAALNKFRQKRKDRCFEKKIRYVSRKRLAEQRPRKRGQFVKQTGGGAKDGDGEDEDDYEDDEDYEEEGEGQGNEEYSPDEEEGSVGAPARSRGGDR